MAHFHANDWWIDTISQQSTGYLSGFHERHHLADNLPEDEGILAGRWKKIKLT